MTQELHPPVPSAQGTTPGDAPPRSTAQLLRDHLCLSDATVEPYYLQLQRQIQTLIETDVLADGASLPSERELAELLQISRTTVKRGYDALRKQQSVVSAPGRGGTTVRRPAPRVSPVMARLKGFTDEMQELGLKPSTRVLACNVMQDRMVASIFGRASTASFLRVIRLRFGDDVPMSREIAWYDLLMAPAMATWDGQGSAYAFLRDHGGLSLTWAQQTIEAVLSSPEETAAFGYDAPGPCLMLKRHTYAADERLVEYVEGTFRGDAYVYRLKLQG